MSLIDKLLNAPRRIRQALSALVHMPTNVSATRMQLAELRSELNALTSAQADLKSELRNELGVLNADRADLRSELRNEFSELNADRAALRSEFLTQLGFALNADRA